MSFPQEKGILSSQARSKTEYRDLDTGSLIDILINEYHESARENAVEIYKLVQKELVRPGKQQSAFAKLAEELFLLFNDLLYHLRKEEDILFPNILQLTENKQQDGAANYSSFGIVRECIASMEKEHQAMTRHFDQVREISRSYGLPDDGSKSQKRLFEKLISFENQMLRHIQLENHFLFPRALLLDNN